jgi:hypothetical protein
MIRLLACNRSRSAESHCAEDGDRGCCGCDENHAVSDMERGLVGMCGDPVEDDFGARRGCGGHYDEAGVIVEKMIVERNEEGQFAGVEAGF